MNPFTEVFTRRDKAIVDTIGESKLLAASREEVITKRKADRTTLLAEIADVQKRYDVQLRKTHAKVEAATTARIEAERRYREATQAEGEAFVQDYGAGTVRDFELNRLRMRLLETADPLIADTCIWVDRVDDRLRASVQFWTNTTQSWATGRRELVQKSDLPTVEASRARVKELHAELLALALSVEGVDAREKCRQVRDECRELCKLHDIEADAPREKLFGLDDEALAA